MAKRRKKSSTRRSSARAITVRAPAPIVVRQSSGISRRAPSRRRRSSGGGSNAVHSLLSNERLGAMLGAAVLGLLDKQGTALPTIPVLGRAGTAGVVLYFLAKQNKSAQIAHAATGCLSIATYELMKDGKISGVDGIDTV